MLKKIRSAVLVSGGGTNLQALLDAQGSAITSGEIALVVSNKQNAYALTRAKKAGVRAVALTQSGPAFEEELCALLLEENIGLVVLAGFLKILSAEFTRRYEGRIINIHPSLIPSFCGAGYYGLKVHEAALQYGVKVTGATVHYVNEVPDGGKILLQKAVEVKEGDTPEVLQKRVMEEAEWLLLPRAAELVCQKLLQAER